MTPQTNAIPMHPCVLARGFARELAPYSMSRERRCPVVAPGIVETGMAKRQCDDELSYRRSASRVIPLGLC